jgi:hypothetical protein
MVATEIKGKDHPITCHEDREGENRYSCTLSLTSALEGGWWSRSQTSRFTTGSD